MTAALSFLAGVLLTLVLCRVALARKARRSHHLNPGAIIMTIRADIQAQLDRLAQVPAAIESAKASAAQAAVIQADQDHADEAAALAAATDTIRSAAGLPPEAAPLG